MADAIHGDISVRVVVHTKLMPWGASPSSTVWRKRLHLVGPTESGQVTSVVRYQEHSQFPPHDHPDGEEILVLSGVFRTSMAIGRRAATCSTRRVFVMPRIPAVAAYSS